MTLRISQPTLIISLAALSIAGFLLWSLWAEIDQITRATGQVIPSGRVQIVQSEEGGTIAQMLVREGDRVTRGQVLVKLDEVRPGAAVEESRAKAAGLMAKMARIQAELLNRPLQFPATARAYPEFVSTQQSLYQARRAALSSQITALNSMLSLVRQELQMNLPLVDSGDVSRSEVLRMQRTASELEGQIVNKRTEYLQELQADYAETEQELVTAQQQLAQRGAVLKGTELRSPTNGVIANIGITTIGGVLAPGDEILQIVPSGDELIVEAKVSPADIAFIRLEQEAAIKFDAYDSGIYGSGKGRVIYISADTLSEETEEGVETYYRVRLAADISTLRPRKPGEKIAIQPGMTVTAEIITGDSTVFRYLTKPILKTSSEALGER
ncbi:MAG: HlyD family efflux transporter periplasmic adaptor subunit [Pseudomonadota bacterium]|nr:HlyD family efflux transporter periplasmic adaptor subunit [Sphingomonas sp.]MDQ3479542.1 HlyD family efflux transporter periplasmic adaptor subunit [Pseudomonadota bacterium]